MRPAIAAAALLLASVQPGLSETCHETFVRHMIGGNDKGPVKIHVVQDIVGGSKSTNHFFQMSTGHWMTQMIDPANQPWTLTYNNTMYTSADKGKSWKKIRSFESQAQGEIALKNRKENAKTVKNAACGEEVLDGVMHDVVEAEFNTLQNFATENHFKYWVNRDTGWISKADYRMKGKGFESFSTQIIEAAPDLTLPTPE